MSLLIASITPVMIFMYLIYSKDKIREPWKLLAKCFFGGFLSIALALLIDAPLAPVANWISSPFLHSFYEAFIVAAGPEELSKFIILYWIVWNSPDFDQHYDGIIYAVFVSLGFALVENIMYVLEGGMGVALTRAVLSVPGHGFFAVLMGYYFSLAKFHVGDEKMKLLLKSLGMPILFHGLYDFALFYMEKEGLDTWILVFLMVLFTYVVIRLWRVGFKKIKLHLQKDHENSIMVEAP
jgi:RsiW-degrading membrane proteinase PrsW (M82 family)